jgi:amidase
VAATYEDKPFEEKSASFIAAANVAKRKYQKEYLDYWNSTAAITGTGRPVDAFIMPLAAIPAARPNQYRSYGKLYILYCMMSCDLLCTRIHHDHQSAGLFCLRVPSDLCG